MMYSNLTKLLLVTIAVISIVGCSKQTNPTAPITSQVNDAEEDYCARWQKIANELLDHSGTVAITENSPQELLWWKTLFIERSGITEQYFNDHIRVISAKEDLLRNRFSIRYAYIINSYVAYDDNAIPLGMTEDEVRKLDSAARYSIATTLYIGSIRVHDVVLESTAACEDLITLAQSKDSTYVATTTMFSNHLEDLRGGLNNPEGYGDDIVVRFKSEEQDCGEWRNNKYKLLYASISTGEILKEVSAGCEMTVL